MAQIRRRLSRRPGRHEDSTAGLEFKRIDSCGMGLKGVPLLPRLHLPDPNLTAPAPCGEELAARIERHAADSPTQFGERPHFLSGRTSHTLIPPPFSSPE